MILGGKDGEERKFLEREKGEGALWSMRWSLVRLYWITTTACLQALADDVLYNFWRTRSIYNHNTNSCQMVLHFCQVCSILAIMYAPTTVVFEIKPEADETWALF
jgi:hypothetical protein